jgi:hypothetical protein
LVGPDPPGAGSAAGTRELYVNRDHFLDVVGREALAGGAEPGPPQRRTST